MKRKPVPRSKRPDASRSLVIPLGHIEHRILLIRGQRVILAYDLAGLYGVPVKRLNEQVKRNSARFPDDFVFQLSPEETAALSGSQIATLNETAASKPRRGSNMKYRPYAFTEHGAIMAANVLRSPRAVQVSVYVVRAFVKLREMLSAHREVARKLAELEGRLQGHDQQIVALIDAIRGLMNEPRPRRKPPIGYHTELTRKK